MACNEIYDRGSAAVIEAEFKLYAPFGSYSYFDPNTIPTITITDDDGTVRVNAVNMTKSDTGKYYYIVQTEVAWIDGAYDVKIVADDDGGVYDDITIDENCFVLR